MISESLYIAERKAIQDLNVRNELRKKITLREKEEREQSLREMANRARLERSGISATGGGSGGGMNNNSYGGDSVHNRLGLEGYGSSDDDEQSSRGGGRGGNNQEEPRGNRPERGYNTDSDESVESIEAFQHETEEEKQARQQRERLRLERRKEREREMRLNNMKGNLKKNKVNNREETRDISEKIALGMLKGTGGKLSGESVFDSRLFNQSSGMDTGFGPEDEYNTYSRPLFDRGEAGSIYRPKASDTDLYGDAESQMAKLSDTSRFRADKGFQGAEGGGKVAPRDAPVQFEKVENSDPYARHSSQRQRDREAETSLHSAASSSSSHRKRARHSDDEDN